MVSGLARSKNLSKMKSPKSNGKSRRNRYCVSKDQRSKSPKLEPTDWRNTADATKVSSDSKVKSGSWKRKSVKRNTPSASSPLKTKDCEQASVSSSRFRPGILYSDVLFSGENPSTLVKIKGLTPRQVGSHAQVTASHSKNRKRTTHRDRTSNSINKDSKGAGADLITLGKKGGATTDENSNNSMPQSSPPKSSSDLTECTKHLMKRLNIEIPSWNFTDFGTFNDIPKFVCQFDDYNYLACERVAFVGLRLASDGKFKS